MATTTRRNVTPAKKGEVVNLPPGWIDVSDNAEVAAKCGDEIANGFWVCSTHREAFNNNLQASAHEYSGRHVAYWYCAMHGPEEA